MYNELPKERERNEREIRPTTSIFRLVLLGLSREESACYTYVWCVLRLAVGLSLENLGHDWGRGVLALCAVISDEYLLTVFSRGESSLVFTRQGEALLHLCVSAEFVTYLEEGGRGNRG